VDDAGCLLGGFLERPYDDVPGLLGLAFQDGDPRMKGGDASRFLYSACGVVMVDDEPIRAPFFEFGLEREGFSFWGDEEDGEEVFQADIYKVGFVPETRCEEP
jgi:hypothetical protein